MTRLEFIGEFAKRAEIPKRWATTYMTIVKEIIEDHMRDEDGVTPVMGLHLHTFYRDEREVICPGTGEVVLGKARYVPKCKFGQNIKKAINQ